MIFALINNGIVENRILAESKEDAEAVCAVVHPGYLVVHIDEALEPQPDHGWLYDGSNFSPPI